MSTTSYIDVYSPVIASIANPVPSYVVTVETELELVLCYTLVATLLRTQPPVPDPCTRPVPAPRM